MLLPETTQIVGLSATIQNPEKLCNLLYQSNKKPVYLCSNKKRVVPLIHHLYYAIPENAKKKISDKTKQLIECSVNKPTVLKKDGVFNDEAVHHIKKIDTALFQYKNITVNKYFIMSKRNIITLTTDTTTLHNGRGNPLKSKLKNRLIYTDF